MVCASRPAARLLRTAAPFELSGLIIRLILRFELPGWYVGTIRLVIRLIVQL